MADPNVRRRVRQALQQSGTSTTGNSPSRWRWFRRPAGLVLAGGITALLLAVAFGIKIFLESLDGAAQPATTAPLTIDPASQAAQASTSAPLTGAAMPILSARTLFYGSRPIRDDRQAPAKEARRDSKSSSESAPLAFQSANEAEQAAAADKATETSSSRRPLGLRYSFLVRESDGQEREVDATTAGKNLGPMRISIEANQEAFLQILQSLGASGTRLWWPPQETGKISLKVLAGKRSEIPLPPPAEGGLLHIIIRLSSKPFAPLTMQEVGMLDRFAANLLIESVPGEGTSAQEHATYVVGQDSSPTAQMTVEIPIRR